MKVRQVQSKSDLRVFINFPYQHYKHDPFWVPPLRSEQYSQFDPKHNPFLEHCKYALFLLEKDGQAIGRIAAFIDNLAVEFWKEPVGLFGYYECIQDHSAAHLLLETAREWLQINRMSTMRGPRSFVSQEWGLVLEGFELPPVVMAPYNPPYYNEQMVAFGLQKVKDLLCYYIAGSEGYKIPDRILTLTDKVALHNQIRTRQINMKRLNEEVRTLMDLSNRSIINNWGYSPVTEAEVQAMAQDLKSVIQPKGVIFAEDAKGSPIGFAIAIPDINTLLRGLNGHLFPFGWLKLLTGIRRLHRYRMFALGVVPEYHGRAVDSLLYRALYESLYTPDIWMEINYVLEDNHPMNNALIKLNAKPLRRYRIYQMNI